MLMSLIPFNAKRSRCGVLGADTTTDARFFKRRNAPPRVNIPNRWHFESKLHQSLLTLSLFFSSKLLLFGIFAIIIHKLI